jgi:hypothetical protein
VGHPGDEVIPIGIEEDLSLVLETPERLGMNDSIPISLVGRSELVRILVLLPTSGLVSFGCRWSE